MAEFGARWEVSNVTSGSVAALTMPPHVQFTGNSGQSRGVDMLMLMRFALALCLSLLAACTRQGGPAPLVKCQVQEGTVAIDGTAQPAISTLCRDEEGNVSLK